MRFTRFVLGLGLLVVTMGHDHGCSCGSGEASGAECVPDSTLTYESFGKPFMEKYCTGCHSSELRGGQARHAAPPDHNFDTLGGVMKDADHIDASTAFGPDARNTRMPPPGNPRPTEMEREQLGIWIACGMP